MVSLKRKLHIMFERAARKPSKLKQMEQTKDAAYHERNQLVAVLSKIYPSGIKKTKIDGWDPEWENCVYIDLPTGQASWHIHDREMNMFKHLKPYKGEWDGHSTEEKYRRLASIKVKRR